MATFSVVAGISLGGLFGLALSCPTIASGISEAIFWGVVIGLLSGGAFGLIFGLIGGIVLAKATDREKLYTVNVDSYKLSMQHLSQSVALVGVLVICALSAVLTIPVHGWEAWLIGILIFVLVPGLIAVFAFRWASKRVADWVVQVHNVQRN